MEFSSILLSVCLLVISSNLCYGQMMHHSKSKRKGMRCKMMQKMENEISSLRHKVDSLSNPVQLHVHGVSQNVDNIVASYNVQEGQMEEEHDEKHTVSHHGHGKRGREKDGHSHGDTSERSSEEEEEKSSEERSGGTQVHIHLNMGGLPNKKEAQHHEHHNEEEDEKTRHDLRQPLSRPEYNYPENEYLHARCDLMRNTAIETPHNVVGTVYLRQKPSGHLEVKVDSYGFQRASRRDPEGPRLHGIHVHEYGDYSNGCNSFGGHFNPEGTSHGGPEHDHRHVGDWGNLEIDHRGVVITEFVDRHSSLIGPHSIMGRGVVIHDGADDHGEGGVEASKASGNAGKRIACCVVAWYSGDIW